MSILGVFHVHSNFSHDGYNSLKDIAENLSHRGFCFCFITDHFEDFNESRFDEYLSIIDDINNSYNFIFIPGVEVKYDGLHILLTPVNDFQTLKSSIKNGSFATFPLRVAAHPSKCPLENVVMISRKPYLNGVEIWNQRADGSLLPPIYLIRKIKNLRSGDLLKIFGLDLHNVKYPVNNFLELENQEEENITMEFIVSKIINKCYLNYNTKTGISLNGHDLSCQELDDIKFRYIIFGNTSGYIRMLLKYIYSVIPKEERKKLEGLKNSYLGYL